MAIAFQIAHSEPMYGNGSPIIDQVFGQGLEVEPGNPRGAGAEDQPEWCRHRTLAGHRRQQRMLGPVAGTSAWVLSPDCSLPGKTKHDFVDPTVAVQVHGVDDESVAELVRHVRESRWRLDFVRSPGRRFVPDVTGEHINQTVAIDVG